MSGHLWKYYFEDNVDAFRQLLEASSYNVRSGPSKTPVLGPSTSLGSPGSLGLSPLLLPKGRRGPASASLSLSRADVNSKDNLGLSLLHYAASSTSENAFGFALALLEHPFTDLYSQDLENGWTSLHRAFYFGNIAIARLILERERRLLMGHGTGGHAQQARGLIKIKDKEGNGPFDLFGLSIQDRLLHDDEMMEHSDLGDEDDNGSNGAGEDDGYGRRERVRPQTNIGGDGVFTFGSNKNVTLGFGDEDDRQYPERISIKRPDHLLQRFYSEHLEAKTNARAELHSGAADAVHNVNTFAIPVTALPTIVRATPLLIQDVQMSKLHTAVLTTDPVSNLYMCGHGPGGRLGAGNESTRFQFTCIEGGGLGSRRVVAIALGQNHSLAISSEGEIFSWGSNACGQLGYALPRTNLVDDEPIQTIPRQIFGPLKKELIIGVAASRVHSVAHTTSSLYTFGKNEGQLGIMDSDARSLEIQLTPRKIAASLFSASICSVAAIDKATVCLLENHEVWIFANYGYSKVQFPLEGFANFFLKASFLTTKYEKTPNRISKVIAGGDTICAMSSSGEIFTMAVKSDPAQDAGTSTTNPTKIRGALSTPICIWSAKKEHMAAKDVGVDIDGSVILTTEEGSVWRRIRRTKIKDATASGTSEYKPKDYKFARISGLTRVAAVRASAHGSYAAIRKDTDVARTQIVVDERSLWADMRPLLSFNSLATKEENSDDEEPAPRFWSRPSQVDMLQRRVLASKDIETDVSNLLRHKLDEDGVAYDAQICTTSSDVRIPIHQFVFAGRSKILREAFTAVKTGAKISLGDLGDVSRLEDSRPLITLNAMDFLTIFDLVLYLYTDNLVSFWSLARSSPKLAFRYRQVRTELIKVANQLQLKQLERAAQLQNTPKRTMHLDFELAIKDKSFLGGGDVMVRLADGEMVVHSGILCQRCPFFEGLFKGRTAGMWLAGRRDVSQDSEKLIDVDLGHVRRDVFRLVMRYLYADAEEELFDNVTSDDLNDYFAIDEMLDLAIEIMGVANELMLSRLSQICQRFVGRYVHTRNVCSLVNSIGPCAVTEFKDAALEYICLNLEALLQSGSLDELDEDLLDELDEIVRENQLACLPISRSGRAEQELFNKYPELAERIDKSKRARIDAIVLSNKFADTEGRQATSFRSQSLEEMSASPVRPRTRRKSQKESKIDADSPASTPRLKGKPSTEMFFEMDEDDMESSGPASPLSRHQQSPSIEPIPFSLSQPKLSIGSPELPMPWSPGSTDPANSSGRPWGAAPATSKAFDMRDIMAQTSSDKQSGIALGLSGQRSDGKPSGSFTTKVSQKERKRMQQRSQQSPASRTPSSTPQPAPAPASPWSGSKSAPKAPPEPPRRVSTPQLTMRQTIANPSTAKNTPTTASHHPLSTHRSISSPHPQNSPASTPRPTSSSTTQLPSPATLTPRSIRHTPMPSRSTLAQPQASMLSILSQQQAEKDYIAAPETRSLQEIQAEQEFQEWWDAESKRVMREEKERERKGGAARRGRSKGRGGKRKDGEGGSGNGEAAGKGERPKVARQQGQREDAAASSSRGGRTSRGRGGGGGGRHHADRGKAKEKQQPASGQNVSSTTSGAS